MTLEESSEATRIFLVTPAAVDPARFPDLLAETLEAAPVAAVLLATGSGPDEMQRLVEPLVPIVQAAGAAALVLDDTRIAGRIGADGVQVSTGRADLEAAVRSQRPRRIVGAASLRSRHAAMEAGELEPDYLFFGDPHGDTFAEPHPKAADLAAWWSELTEIPAVLMLGADLDAAAAVLGSGIPFIGAHRIVWEDPAGAPAGLARLHRALRPAEAVS